MNGRRAPGATTPPIPSRVAPGRPIMDRVTSRRDSVLRRRRDVLDEAVVSIRPSAAVGSSPGSTGMLTTVSVEPVSGRVCLGATTRALRAARTGPSTVNLSAPDCASCTSVRTRSLTMVACRVSGLAAENGRIPPSSW